MVSPMYKKYLLYLVSPYRGTRPTKTITSYYVRSPLSMCINAGDIDDIDDDIDNDIDSKSIDLMDYNINYNDYIDELYFDKEIAMFYFNEKDDIFYLE